MISPKGRLRQAFSVSSSSAAARLTWEEEFVVPQSCSVMAATLRVETPWIYISANVRRKALSLRRPFYNASG